MVRLSPFTPYPFRLWVAMLEVSSSPYTVRRYSFGLETKLYSLTEHCGLVIYGGDRIVFVNGSAGVESIRGCRSNGRIIRVGPHTLVYEFQKKIEVYDYSCSRLARLAKRSTLIASNEYCSIVVGRREGVIVFDSIRGMWAGSVPEAKKALKTVCGVDFALVGVSEGALLVSPNGVIELPLSLENARPLVKYDSMFIVYSGGRLLGIDVYGVTEVLGSCGRLETLVARDATAIQCDTLVLGKPIHEAARLVQYVELVKNAGDIVVSCLPYIYAVKDAELTVYDFSRPSLAVRYKPLTGKDFVELGSGVRLGDIIVPDEETKGKQDCSLSYTLNNYHVTRGGLRVKVSIKRDIYMDVFDASCIDNCSIVSINSNTIEVKLHDPLRKAILQLGLRSCGYRTIEVPAAAHVLVDGYALPTSNGVKGLVVIGGNVLVRGENGDWSLLKPGFHSVNGELVEVIDSNGHHVFRLNNNPLEVKVDYEKGVLAVRGVSEVYCTGSKPATAHGDGITLGVENGVCSLRTNGAWVLVAPLQELLKLALKVSNRIAEIAKLT